MLGSSALGDVVQAVVFVIAEANFDFYLGALAYFKGEEVRVANLTPKEIEKVKDAVNYSNKP